MTSIEVMVPPARPVTIATAPVPVASVIMIDGTLVKPLPPNVISIPVNAPLLTPTCPNAVAGPPPPENVRKTSCGSPGVHPEPGDVGWTCVTWPFATVAVYDEPEPLPPCAATVGAL